MLFETKMTNIHNKNSHGFTVTGVPKNLLTHNLLRHRREFISPNISVLVVSVNFAQLKHQPL